MRPKKCPLARPRRSAAEPISKMLSICPSNLGGSLRPIGSKAILSYRTSCRVVVCFGHSDAILQESQIVSFRLGDGELFIWVRVPSKFRQVSLSCPEHTRLQVVRNRWKYFGSGFEDLPDGRLELGLPDLGDCLAGGFGDPCRTVVSDS